MPIPLYCIFFFKKKGKFALLFNQNKNVKYLNKIHERELKRPIKIRIFALSVSSPAAGTQIIQIYWNT